MILSPQNRHIISMYQHVTFPLLFSTQISTASNLRKA